MARYFQLFNQFSWGGSTGKPENIPTIPDPGNAGEGIKKRTKRVLVNTKALIF
jgi:hypothetical protein